MEAHRNEATARRRSQEVGTAGAVLESPDLAKATCRKLDAPTDATHDERLDDPTELLLGRRKPNGRWPLQKRIPGTLLVSASGLVCDREVV